MTPRAETSRDAPLRAADLATIFGGLVASLWMNFHWYLPDFDLVPGDRGDTRLVVFTLEHWFRVLVGAEPFFRLQMFFPDRNALGYADGLFLFGVPYSVFRLVGLDYFSSYQLLMVVLTALGYFGWMVVLRRLAGFSLMLAAVGGVLLSGLNALQLQADIGKLSATNQFPFLLLWLWTYVRAKNRNGWRTPLALAGFSAGLGFLFFTSYYPAWLLLFTLAVFAGICIAASVVINGVGGAARGLWTFARDSRWHLMLAAGAFVLALMPFIITYAPLIAEGSRRGFDLVLEFSPRVGDVANVSPNNVIWGPFFQEAGFSFGNRERQMGSPLIVLVVAGMTVTYLIRRISKVDWHELPASERVILLLAATAATLVALSVRIGDYSLWYLIYAMVPGASALRAVGRVLIIVDLIVVVLALWGLQRFARANKGRGMGPQVVVAAVCLALLAEQVNWAPFRLSKSQQLAMLERYSIPTQECGAFYINHAEREDQPFGYYQLDAMMVGMHLAIPTVNGYSGFEPHDAFTLVPNGPEYQYRILDWLLGRGATHGICELDMENHVFRSVDVQDEFEAAQQNFRDQLMQEFGALFDAATRFGADGGDLRDLYPQNLEENGYLDPSFGHEGGARYKWINGRYWIGERGCGNMRCFGIAVVGEFADLAHIVAAYGPRAREVLFPSPEPLNTAAMPDADARGELLLIFPLPSPAD